MKKSLSIVGFVHNISRRGSFRLCNMFMSIRQQKHSFVKDPDIILVNCSNDDSYEEVNNICVEYKVLHLFHQHLEKTWNKCLALNAGLLRVETNFTMFTDVDYIFAPNFLECIMPSMSSKRILLCRTTDSPKGLDLTNYDVSQFYEIEKLCRLHPKYGEGACQLSNTGWFKKCGGYDERMKMWGGMDNDIPRRAVKSGKKKIWIKNCAIHQWHPIHSKQHWPKINKSFLNGPVNRNTKINIGNLKIDKVEDSR